MIQPSWASTLALADVRLDVKASDELGHNGLADELLRKGEPYSGAHSRDRAPPTSSLATSSPYADSGEDVLGFAHAAGVKRPELAV